MDEQNKGNNEEEWWECAWVKIIILIVICVMPIIINWVTTFENGSHDYDTPSPWTEIWAEYGGALLSAGIALFVLHKQHKQNHEENEANRIQNELQNKINRELQIRQMQYQQKCAWLNELRKGLVRIYVAENINNISSLVNRIIEHEETCKIEIDRRKLFNEIAVAMYSYEFLYPSLDNLSKWQDSKGNDQKYYYSALHKEHLKYTDYLRILGLYISLGCKNFDEEVVIKEYSTFKENISVKDSNKKGKELIINTKRLIHALLQYEQEKMEYDFNVEEGRKEIAEKVLSNN